MLFALVVGTVGGATIADNYSKEWVRHSHTLQRVYRILILFPHTSVQARARAEAAMEVRQREKGIIVFMKQRATFCMKSLGKCQ